MRADERDADLQALELDELIEELRARTEPTASDVRVEALVAELRARAPIARGEVDAGLLAASLPLLHRVGPEHVRPLLEGLAGGATALRPGEGSATRRELLEELGERPCVYFWLGHCAYGRPDPALLWVWSAAAERVGPPGMAAPWDSAGLTTEATLGRNLNQQQAFACVTKYSLPIEHSGGSLHRQYLKVVLERSFDHPDSYWQAHPPSRWYPGWLMEPRRDDHGGTPAEPPHHTFEVRRAGDVDVRHGLIAVIVRASSLAGGGSTVRALEAFARQHAVWNEGRRVHRVNTDGGRTVLRTASDLVRRFLNEELPT